MQRVVLTLILAGSFALPAQGMAQDAFRTDHVLYFSAGWRVSKPAPQNVLQLPTTWHPVPHVGTARDQGSGFASCTHSQVGRLFCRRQFAHRQVHPLSVRHVQFKGGDNDYELRQLFY